ncbi:MAG: hypothetical protein RR054_05980 [Clostridia bacterium]
MTEIRDLPYYDLRKVRSVSEAANIRIIEDVALVVFPKECDEELFQALRQIPMEEVAATIELDKDDKIKVFNGITELTDDDFKDQCTVVCVNGVCFIKDVKPTTKGIVIMNGMLLLQESMKGNTALEFPIINGKRYYIDAERMLSYDNKVCISERFLDYIKPKTVIVAGNKIQIESRVTVDEIEKTKVILVAMNKIVCSIKLAGYISNVAIFGNKVEVDEID